MRPPAARFPFIISFKQNNLERETGDNAMLLFMQDIREEIKSLSRGNEKKFSLILQKMVFLESSLDEILETEPSEKSEIVTHSLLEEKQQQIKKFFIGLIPILDSLDAACSSALESEESELSSGLELFNRKLVRHLASREFLKSVDLGMKFDPLLHEAVGSGPSPSLESGTIMDIVENGWTFEGKVLRFAKVIVVK